MSTLLKCWFAVILLSSSPVTHAEDRPRFLNLEELPLPRSVVVMKNRLMLQFKETPPQCLAIAARDSTKLSEGADQRVRVTCGKDLIGLARVMIKPKATTGDVQFIFDTNDEAAGAARVLKPRNSAPVPQQP